MTLAGNSAVEHDIKTTIATLFKAVTKATGQCFIAVDPEAFAPGFYERMQELINTLRSLPPFDDKLHVMVAGDPESKHVKLVKELGGIPYHPNQIKNCDLISGKLNVKKVKVIKEY
ncbi:hypothetical protein ANCDUO_18588 [Ancylostoma duodenale]|uniref:Uncharacterized protein n=1 Tax=Ancylostoma duodenale TaxID=51022 RepID=A0A0C2CNJ9_9BILA|nr:hypothetical protein ANCDUO_18588 [Ancylostoma duodenale]